MKTCPTCHTLVFEDMAVCYSCLHRFGEEPPADAETKEAPPVDSSAAHSASAGAPDVDECFLELDEALPACAISNISAPAPDWVIRLEMRSEEHPQRVWSMQLNPASWAALEVA